MNNHKKNQLHDQKVSAYLVPEMIRDEQEQTYEEMGDRVGIFQEGIKSELKQYTFHLQNQMSNNYFWAGKVCSLIFWEMSGVLYINVD